MIKPCHNMAIINDFMRLPEVNYYAAEYGAEDEDFEYDDRRCWLFYSVDGHDIGLIKFYLLTGAMGMFHPYILRRFKKNYDVMVQEFFGWFLDNVPEQIYKLNVAIPKQFNGAIKAAHTAGMITEGVDRMSYLSETGPCDRMLLGITREEMK